MSLIILTLKEDAWVELSRFQELEKFSAIDCGIRSLLGFPLLPKLRVLVLHDNQLDEFTVLQHTCPELQRLGIANNFVFFPSQLEPLRHLPKLVSLDVEDNDVCNILRFEVYMSRNFRNVKRHVVDFYDSDSDDDTGAN
ncbi:acidic leucine-rich nuclear phosphoprotein 32 family member A-like [Paramacrobiotus metropolitanus]|uniref:acidic leucine-rich nuclear phosphoprotein 32 family member A-like n=1 Tax=Paramacrobiotus metropolitanus TaxID=2943436 RepID=UPI002445865D|nr:acidic leucine-rich nuclear phosphoprotein 32 family member A-like [Paramacrobiotus metropolitanus]